MNFGHLLSNTGRQLEAIGYLERALATNPDNVECRVSLAACLIQLGRYSEAIEYCQQALRLKPDSVSSLVNLACAEQGLGRSDSAIAACRAAIELDPKLPNAHATLAVLIRDTEPEEALKHMGIACKLELHQATYDIAMGDMLVAQSPSEALRYYQSALGKNNDCVDAHLAIANLLEDMNLPEQAIAHVEAILRLQPDSPQMESYLEKLLTK
jgi:tetratricopeptide (TPR) repeat protein